jgi:hypothetical protein
MPSKQSIQILAQSNSKRAANENVRKRLETLENKFQELWEDYGIDIWFIARRSDGRFRTYTTTDEPSPGPETLVYLLFHYFTDN